MVEAVRGHFAEQGVQPTGFYYEKFALSATTPAPAPATVPVAAPVAAPVEVDAPGHVPATSDPTPEVAEAPLLEKAGRAIAGQELFPTHELVGLRAGVTLHPVVAEATARAIAGQEAFPSREVVALVERAPAAAPEPDTTDGYEIGEEHPSVHASDAIFEARMALELGALDLVLGRIDSRQVAGYRLLAESTVPYVEGERFVDAAAYTETNAAFHDYLFTLTGNEHLLRAYQALGVRGRMEEVLRAATWCHPRCAQDHLDIVDAVERGDRTSARELVSAHADRSKATMRRAMEESRTAGRPRFTTPGRFAGKVVLVTGAAQGIGEAVARRVGAEDGLLVLADRSDLVHELADELAATGPGALAVVADLEAYDGAAAVVEQAVARFGRVDVLVNNVGGAINFKPFTEFTDIEIGAEVQRSLMTTLFACRAVLPSMVQRGAGVIVNVSSAATRGIHRIPYSAAKGGINAITASLALEYADHGIRVVATAPGGTEAPPRRISRGTPAPQDEREQEWFQAHIDQTLSHSLMHRYGSLDEQAAAITFLASEEASYITGTVLPVAGGDLG
jgi:benzoate/toluate 1,2-dioxygenase reductase subunit